MLIERDNQLRRLRRLYTVVQGGSGRVAVLSGPVASGKTALLQHWTDAAAASGATVLRAHATGAERILPLGVIDQLLHTADLSPDTADRAARLLDEGVRTVWRHAVSEAVDVAEAAPVLRGLCQALLEPAQRAPLIISVDDVHHADPASLQCLSHLARRIRSAPVLLILTERSQPLPDSSLLHTQLSTQTYYRRIRLAPLARRGVAALLAREPDPGLSRLAAEYHALTGGNPLLLNALMVDRRRSAKAPEEPVIGTAFDEAVVNLLHRCEPVVRQLVRAMAVLGSPVPAEALGRLLGQETRQWERAVHLLTRAGLLASGWFRHPRVGAAVLDSMPAAERAALHARAAQMWYAEEAPAAVVAEHLVLAGHAAERRTVAEPWMTDTLREAAERALDNDDCAGALTYLRAGLAGAPDERRRAVLTGLLIRVEWRLNPARALRHLPEVVAAVREGHLTGVDAALTVGYLLWYGHADEASDLIAGLYETGTLDPAAVPALNVARMWLVHLLPEHADRFAAERTSQNSGDAEPLTETLRRHVVAALTDAAGPRPDDPQVIAEQTLRDSRLDDTTMPLITAAIATLLSERRLDQANAHCESFLREATTRGAPTWQAALLALHANIAFVQGDLPAAEERGHRALETISASGWGAVVGGVLATTVLAATGAGRYEAAAECLAVPVPTDLFEGTCGLQYRRARGLYYLATNRLNPALSDLRACGEMMQRWGVELPVLVPWRIDVAKTYLALGRRPEAAELAAEQLRQLPPTQAAARGAALRVLATASELPAERLRLLKRAVLLLRGGHDRLELAHALADLSEVFDEVGIASSARLTLRAARKLAIECQAHGLLHALPEETAARLRLPFRQVGTAEELSEAERRVAALAAVGHTNREIAKALYVTVGTVEQHLTRVYRKLRVSGRADLPPVFLPGQPRPRHP